MRVDDPTLSMVAIRRRVVSFSGASVSMTVQRPGLIDGAMFEVKLTSGATVPVRLGQFVPHISERIPAVRFGRW